MKPNIRLIATDLDGTLLGKGSAILPQNTEALKQAESAGIVLAITSGRLPAVCSRIARDMGLDGCRIIGLNGGQVWTRPFGTELCRHRLAPEAAALCWQAAKAANAPTTLYVPDGIYTNQQFDSEDAARRYRAHFDGAGVRVEIGPDAVERGMQTEPLKFLVKFPDGETQRRAVLASLECVPGIAMTSSKAGTIEIMPPGIGKAGALAALTRSLGLSPCNVMAFGDYDNDLTMLSWAGFGVAMGNASPEVKRAAKYTTATNDEAGVAAAVQALLGGRLFG